jgi:hypothetical protein
MKPEKLFVVRKYVMAKDAKTAIKKERSHPVDDVFVDDEWRKQQEFNRPMQGFKSKKNG